LINNIFYIGMNMIYPTSFTTDDIMEFEYEYNRYLDLENPYSFEHINAELQSVVHDEEDNYIDDHWQEHHLIPIHWCSSDLSN